MDYRIAKGVYDILPKDPENEKWRETHLWHYLEKIIRELSALYGFREIRTPLFEHTELFLRGVGKTSDIISKEMYSFEDKGGRHISLRPEGTAPVIRAFIEKHLHTLGPIQKFFYINAMFRYERQQAGRYRQHHQFGVEAIGSSSPLQDVEAIDLLYSFLKKLGLKGVTLHLNSIGSLETRTRFKEALKSFLLPQFGELSQESQERFHHNPLRILDSKNPHDKKLLENAPLILDFLDEGSKEHFESVCQALQSIGIDFNLNPLLVRGLDYYNSTVFEITSNELGAQNSLGGGGRYDSLISDLGGPPLPAFGFGAGIERILQTCLAQGVFLPHAPRTDLYLIPLGKPAEDKCFALMTSLRTKGIAVEMDFSGKKLKNALRVADGMQCRYVGIVGDEELAAHKLQLKEMKTGVTELISFESVEKIYEQFKKE